MSDPLPRPVDELLPSASTPAQVHLGIFDSGVGGLSVLRAVQALLPSARLTYVADSGFAPYGERTDEFIVQRSMKIASFLKHQGVDVIVVACNTATAAAVQAIRESEPDFPVVGVEPGVKPAVSATRNGRIGVMATTSTLNSERFQRLIQSYAQNVRITQQPCPGLAKAIESGQSDSAELHDLVQRFSQPLIQADVDTVVLGCTHYPFVAPLIQQALGHHVILIDTAGAIARRVQQLIQQRQLPQRTSVDKPNSMPDLSLWTSGDPVQLERIAQHWLGYSGTAQPLPSPYHQ